MKQRSPLQLAELQARLTRLRETAAWLVSHAGIGSELRQTLAAAGCQTWSPAEDLSWRSWVERHGDEDAREFLAAIDELLEERAAELGSGTNANSVVTCAPRAPATPAIVPRRAR